MKLDGITTFIAIAEAGSISDAARRLRLSKSVVSDRLADLERSLGARLVHRTTRNLTLMEDGSALSFTPPCAPVAASRQGAEVSGGHARVRPGSAAPVPGEQRSVRAQA